MLPCRLVSRKMRSLRKSSTYFATQVCGHLCAYSLAFISRNFVLNDKGPGRGKWEAAAAAVLPKKRVQQLTAIRSAISPRQALKTCHAHRADKCEIMYNGPLTLTNRTRLTSSFSIKAIVMFFRNVFNELSYRNMQHVIYGLADRDDAFFSSFSRGPLPKDGSGVCIRRNQVLLEVQVSYE